MTNDQTVDQSTLKRRVTDATLLIIAVGAVASWPWRRLKAPATIDAMSERAETQLDDKVGSAVGFPPDSATA